MWAPSGTRLYGTQRNVLQTCDPQADQANCEPQAVPDCIVHNETYYKLATHKRTKQTVSHKRYQTVLYTTERITNLRPTSRPSNMWATSGTRLYGTQRNVLQTCDPPADQAIRGLQAVPDCMVHNETYYKLATHKRTKQTVSHKRYQTVLYTTERITNLRPTSRPSNMWASSGTRLYGTQRSRITNLRPTSRPSNMWATSGTRLYGTQRNVLQTCDPPADQAIRGLQAVPDCMVHNETYYKLATHKRTKQNVSHKRYQTVWYTTERITNLRPTSRPSNLWATSGTRLYGTQRNVLQTCDPQADQAKCEPQAVPDCMVHNGTYYKLATHQQTKQSVGHKRYQTVWYTTKRITNLRPTSGPSKM